KKEISPFYPHCFSVRPAFSQTFLFRLRKQKKLNRQKRLLTTPTFRITALRKTGLTAKPGIPKRKRTYSLSALLFTAADRTVTTWQWMMRTAARVSWAPQIWKKAFMTKTVVSSRLTTARQV